MRSTSALISVPLPAPDGPVMTKTGRLAVEKPNQLCPLAFREAPHCLRLADATLIEETRRLDAAELRHRHQHVEDLCGRDELGRVAEDLLDLHPADLEVLLQLRAPNSDVVGPTQSLHALVKRACRGLRLGLRHHRGSESNSVGTAVKRVRLR